MIKFGSKRINIAMATGYFPLGSTQIEIQYISNSIEKVSFESTEERDKMLEAMDKYLVDWEDGKHKMGEIRSLADLLHSLQDGPVEGGPPEGTTVQ